MPKKHSIRFFFLVAALVYAAYFYVTARNTPPPVPAAAVAPQPAPVPAFLGTAWGMNAREAQLALGSPLTPAAFEPQFYSPPKLEKNLAKLRTYQAEDVSFLGRPSKVTLVFYKDRLFMYRVFIRSNEGERLDDEVSRYLRDQYGSGFVEEEAGFAAKIIWQTRDLLVNYWFYEDDLKLRQKYTAGFAVIYQPIESLIQ